MSVTEEVVSVTESDTDGVRGFCVSSRISLFRVTQQSQSDRYRNLDTEYTIYIVNL